MPRAYRADDYRAVRAIYLDTAYYGEPLTPARFADPTLFALLYLDCYLAAAHRNYCFVFERQQEVVGYINGAPDTAAFNAYYRAHQIACIEERLASLSAARYSRERSVTSTVLAGWRADLAADSPLERIMRTHPAHLHINVAPKMQRAGVGGRLLRHYEERCRRAHALGVHLITTNYNTHACAFYEQHGYRLLHRMPGAGSWPERPDAVSLVYGKRL